MSGGQGVTTGQGSGTGSTFIGLRSRKVGAGTTDRELAGSVIALAGGTLSANRVISLTGLSSSLVSGAIGIGGGGAAYSWVGTPAPVFSAGVGGSVDISSYLSGGYQVGDSITIVSGNPGFVNSPSGSLISVTGTQAEGSYGPMVLGFSRGGGAVVNSANITITVVTADVNLSRKYESGGMQFIGSFQNNQNAPLPNTFFNFGKQQQQVVAQIGGVWKLIHTEGDGANKWNNVSGNTLGNGTTYNDVLAFDFNNLASGVTVDQLFDGFGKNKDGVIVSSYSVPQEGGTVVWDATRGKITLIPGFIRGPAVAGSEDDPYSVMGAGWGHVHFYDPVALTATAGASAAGNWPGENWGGAWNVADGKIYIQCPTGGENNGINIYDPATDTFSAASFTNGNVATIPIYPGLGRALSTHHWRQKFWDLTHELICLDQFRGMLLAIDVTTMNVRIITDKLGRRKAVSYPSGDVEGVSTQEAGLTIDQTNNICYVTAQDVIYFEDPSEHFDIASIDLNTGEVKKIRAPNPTMKLASIEWVPKASGGGNLVAFDTEDTRYTQKFFVFSTPPAGLKRSATLMSTGLHEVREIPNSQLTSSANLFVINACRANAQLPLLTALGQVATQGTNKDGITYANWEGRTWPPSNGANGYGHVPDPKDRRWIFRMGDVQTFAHNGVASFNIDSEDWTPEIVKTINHLELRLPDSGTGLYRDPNTNGWTGEYSPATLFRNWNGGCVAQHGYYTACLFGKYNQFFGHISGQQPGPGDSGGTSECIIANTSDGVWLNSKPMPDRPGWANDVQDWVETHPINRHLVYSYSYNTGHVHVCDTSVSPGANSNVWSWTQVTASAIPGGFRCSYSFDTENNELLLIGQASSVKKAYTVNLSSGAVTEVTLTGSGASGVDPWFYGGMTYDPESHKHYVMQHTSPGVLYSITRTNATTFTCVQITLTGVTLNPSWWDLQLGGMLKRLCAMPGMGGLVLQVTDTRPLYFIGTV